MIRRSSNAWFATTLMGSTYPGEEMAVIGGIAQDSTQNSNGGVVVVANRWFGFGCTRGRDVARHLLDEPIAPRKPAAECLHKPLEPLKALGARGCLRIVRQWRRDRQPEPDEQGDCFTEDGEILVHTVDLAAEPVHAPRENRL